MRFLSLDDFLLPCVNKAIFGIECMGCGMQRSLVLLVSGEFGAAFKMFPAIYSLLLLLLVVGLNFFVKFKYAYHIKMALILLNGAIIVASYFFKVKGYF